MLAPHGGGDTSTVSNGPSIALLAVPAIISASAALAGVGLNSALSRRAQRQRQREERYGEAIRLARRIVYLLLTTPAPGDSDGRLARQQEITEAEAEYALVTATSLHTTSAEFVKACRIFDAAMTDESTEPRTQDLQRLMLSLPIRTQQERVTSAQTMYDALTRMVDVADRDLMSHRLRLIPRR
jgi:hypothetical protein